MQVIRFLTPIFTPVIFFAACSPVVDRAAAQDPVAPGAQTAGINLSASQKAAIGKKIWQNESGGTINGLTAWNAGEEFPSMGIGHFIWYPKGFNGRWTESFPEFIRYAQSRGVTPPAVALSPNCPWPNKAAFQRDFNGAALGGLRNWLSQTIPLQTDFIVFKSRAALPSILRAAPANQRARIQANYHKVATTPNGTYALIDYVNFKGEGTNPTETYADQGWGLMWVLMEMREVPAGQAAAREFAAASKRRLDLRIKNSPQARGENRWREGWHNRCNSYAQAF